MKRPLTGLAVVYALGILAGWGGSWSATVLLAVGLVSLALFFLCWRTRASLPLLLLAVLAAGALSYRTATTVHSPRHVVNVLSHQSQNVGLRGVIVSDTGWRDFAGEAGGAERLRFKLRLSAVRDFEGWQPAEGTVLVFVSEARERQPLRYGERIECSALLSVPPPQRNPGTFDWRGWLYRQRIFFTATIRKTDTLTVLERGRANPLMAASLRLRQYFERALRLGLEEEPRVAGLLAAMVIGQRAEIPPDTRQDFQRTGVFHVFAISGLHVGMVTIVVLVALRVMQIPRRWCALAAIPLLTLYVFATGARPGAVRALAMACVVLSGWALVRPVDAWNILAAAALAILLWNPTQLFDGGFILSFTVVSSLVALTPVLEARLQRLARPDPLLPRQLAPWWRRKLEKPLSRFVTLVSGSVAACVGMAPMMALYFNLFTPISVAANVMVVPLLGLVIALGMLSMLAFPVWPLLAEMFNNANFLLLNVMMSVVEWLSRVPHGYQFIVTPSLWIVAGFYGAVIGLLWARAAGFSLLWPPRRAAAWVVAPLIGLGVGAGLAREQTARITVLDLNDGTAIFLDLPGQTEDILIDGATAWSAREVLLPFLRSQGVDRLGRIILTSAVKSHAEGLSVIAAEVPVKEAINSGVGSRSVYYRHWREAMDRQGIAIRDVRAGYEVELATARLQVLHPPLNSRFTRSDDNSLVLMLEFGPNRVLLMSDAGETVERVLLAGGADLRADILIKGRHGKESSCLPEFLEAVQPQAVIVAAARWPPTRYPEAGLAERLRQRGVKMYRTDENGAVIVGLTRRGHEIQTWRN
jgi:competence protein ComEC